MKDGKLHIEQQKLQKLLSQKANALSEEAIRAGGKIDVSQLEELERLERLVKAQASASKPRRKMQWSFLFVFIATLLIVSLLLFMRVSTTDIELKILVSETSFRIPKQQFLTNLMRLSSLGISGLKKIDLPRSENKVAHEFYATDGSEFSIQLSDSDSLQQTGTLTLGAIPLTTNTFVWLRAGEQPGQFGLTIKDTDLIIHAGVNGKIGMGMSTSGPEHLNFLSPNAITLKSGSGDVDLDFKLVGGLENSFSRQLLVDSISFMSIEEHNEDEHTTVRNLSTILSGIMYLESLGGHEYHFRPSEEIRFGSSKGEIRTLRLENNHLAISFHGTVTGMTSGADTNSKSLMPTYLEWLKARHGFTLLWGSTLYIFGLIFTIFKWWRTPL